MSQTERVLIEGRGVFVDDLNLPQMLYMHVVRSPFARAVIGRISGGINGNELKANMISTGEGGGGKVFVPFHALSADRVNYVGQPVAAVLGKSREEAEDLSESVVVDYQPLKPIVDPELSLVSEPIHPGTTSNEFGRTELGTDFELADAPVKLERTLVNERIVPNPMETRGFLASYEGGRLKVYMPTQSVYSIQRGLSTVLGLPRESIHVVQTDTGGAFGTKGALYPEYVVAAYASMKYKKPVKWVETRSEHLVATNQGRGVRAKMQLYADRSGRVLGLKADILVDGGAYPVGNGEFAPGWIGFQITGPYSISRVYVKGRSVFTNKVPLGPYRGAGRPEAAFFIERMMDMLADELRMDPLDVRMRNASSSPFTSPLGLTVDPLLPFLDAASRTLRYREKAAGSHVGLSSFVLIPAAQPGESARVKVSKGVVDVWLGGSTNGQGHDVIVRKLLHDELGVPESAVRYNKSDTDQLDRGVGSWGSRTALVGGMAVVDAAKQLIAQVRQRHGEYSPEKLLDGEYDVKTFYQPTSSMTSLGVNLVSVEADPLEGLRISECSAYYDVGTPLNPEMVRGQVIGGSAQAIGQVLYEVMRLNDEGVPVVGSIGDTGVPTASEIPNINVYMAVNEESLTKGSKGVGESPTIGVPPALVRAIERLTGNRIDRTPIPPETLGVLHESGL
jgi:carbon-monoxide dehydrogenase large subunit